MTPNGVCSGRPPAKGLPPSAVWQSLQSPASTRYLPRWMRLKSVSARLAVANAATQTAPAKRACFSALFIARSSRLHQRSGVLEILVADRIRRPIGQRADGTGRVVAGVLRKHRRAHDEHVRHVPALQIA